MKKICLTFIFLIFATTSYAGDWTEVSWQKINGITDIPGPVTIAGELEVTGDRVQLQRTHYQYDLTEGTTCNTSEWEPSAACGDHTTSHTYVTSFEDPVELCNNDDTTCRGNYLVAHYGDTLSYSASFTADRAGAWVDGLGPTFPENGALMMFERYGGWNGYEWPGTFHKVVQVKRPLEMEEAPFTTCDTTDNEIDTTAAHGLSDDDVIQIRSGTTNISIDSVEISAFNTYYADVIDSDSVSLCDTVVSGGSCPAEKDITACGSGTRKLISNDTGGRVEWYTRKTGDAVTTATKSMQLYSDGSLYLKNVLLDTRPVTVVAVEGDTVYTGAQIFGGIIVRDPTNLSRNDGLPNLNGVLGLFDSENNECVDGMGFDFTVINTADAAETITLSCSTCTSLTGNMVIGQDESRSFHYKISDCAGTMDVYALD